MQQRFENKVVIVIGGGSGIGAAAALRFAAEGATVVISGRSQERLDKVVARSSGPGVVEALAADATDESVVTGMVDQVVSRHGRLDVLVNSAGVLSRGRIEETDGALYRQIMAIDLDAVFFACRAAIGHLTESRGSIVNVSSVAGLRGDWGNVGYNAAKAAVCNLTAAMALDHGRDGVRVNCVCPGLIYTEMTDLMTAMPEITAAFEDRIALGRGAQPEEVGDVIAFLASAEASYVTGVNLPVDGGVLASTGLPRIVA